VSDILLGAQAGDQFALKEKDFLRQITELTAERDQWCVDFFVFSEISCFPKSRFPKSRVLYFSLVVWGFFFFFFICRLVLFRLAYT
jgi:hypothetical protein